MSSVSTTTHPSDDSLPLTPSPTLERPWDLGPVNTQSSYHTINSALNSIHNLSLQNTTASHTYNTQSHSTQVFRPPTGPSRQLSPGVPHEGSRSRRREREDRQCLLSEAGTSEADPTMESYYSSTKYFNVPSNISFYKREADRRRALESLEHSRNLLKALREPRSRSVPAKFKSILPQFEKTLQEGGRYLGRQSRKDKDLAHLNPNGDDTPRRDADSKAYKRCRRGRERDSKRDKDKKPAERTSSLFTTPHYLPRCSASSACVSMHGLRQKS